MAAGADIVQLFDTWTAHLGPDEYRALALPYSRRVIAGLAGVTSSNPSSLGTRGDICFWDMSQDLGWEKGGGESINPWISWLTHEDAIRLTLRLDGQPALASAITPFKGSNTQSPFVALATSTS